MKTPNPIEAQNSRARLVIAAALILLPLIYFLPVFIWKLTLVPGDGLSQNLGVRILIGQMIANGQVPLWNPYIFAGTPLLASIYPGGLYPPNWVFGPVWSVLYLFMAIAAWLVWRQLGWPGAAVPLALFVVQLLLNGAWTGLFFGLHKPWVAFAEIILLWCAILATLSS
mgnify:CR=1 FL=1